MNGLPDEIRNKIYKYKHQIEYKSVMDELLDRFTDLINDDLYFENKHQLLRYLRNNINDIDCIIFNNGKRLEVLEYIKILHRHILH